MLAGAVTEVLAVAGFRQAPIGSNGHPASDGAVVAPLMVPGTERVSVSWYCADGTRTCRCHGTPPELEECARVLRAAGYQAERIADRPADYLAVWAEGDF